MAYPYQPIPLMGEASYNPMDTLEGGMRMQALRQDAQLRQMKLAELMRQIQDQAAQRQAANSAATYAPSANVQSPAMTLGSIGGQELTLPAQSQTVQGPAGADFRAQYIQKLGELGQGQMIPDQLAAQAHEKQAQAEQVKATLAQMDATQRKNFGEAADLIGRASQTILNAPPEARPGIYQAVHAQLLRHPNPIVAQMIQQQPPQYSPQMDGMLQSAAGQAMSVKDQIDAHEKQNKPEKQDSVDQQALDAYMKANPGKNAADFLVWKAKNSPSGSMAAGINLTPEATAMAAQLYSQTGQLPGGFSRAPQVTSQVINQAAKGNPNIAENKVGFGAKKATATYFASGAGGKQLTAFNTAINHLDTLDRLAGDLNNTDIQVVNRAKQAWAQQTGSAAPANFEAAKNAMSGEVAAALKASGATDQEITHVSDTFSRAQSPSQLKGAIGTYRELLKGKAVQLRKQYDAGMKGGAAFTEQPQGEGFDWNAHPQVK